MIATIRSTIQKELLQIRNNSKVEMKHSITKIEDRKIKQWKYQDCLQFLEKYLELFHKLKLSHDITFN